MLNTKNPHFPAFIEHTGPPDREGDK